MTTATVPAVKTFTVTVYWKGDAIALTAGSKTCKIDQKNYDHVSFSDEAQNEYDRMVKERNGRQEFQTTMTTDQMKLWVEIRDALANYKPEPTVSAPTANLDIKPALTEEKPAESKPAPAAPVLASMANHTATVEGTGPDYIGGPSPNAKKTRKRKTDPDIKALYEDVTEYCRAWDMDTLIRRIKSLKSAKAFLSGKVKRITYDIPKVIRDEINEPARIFRCIGFMPTESEVIAREEALERGIYIAYRNILGRYMKGTDNAKRLGCFVKFRVTDISYENVNELNEEVSENLDEAVRAAHTRLIVGLDSADKALTEAQGDEKLTLADLDQAQRDRDNAYRAALRKAHEELNTVLRCAEGFDHDENIDTLIEGLHALTRTRAATFNAECAKRGANGVTI